MESRIAQALHLSCQPVAVVFSDQKPESARSFKEGKWGCVMFLLAAAVKGETAAFDRKTFGCPGGGTGLGFGNQYPTFAGGEECFKYFLSSGNEQWEQGRRVAEEVKPYMRPESHHQFLHGERYLKNPALVDRFLGSLPMTEIPTTYLLFQPLGEVQEDPQTVVFLADPDQISALTVLANYGRGDNENVIFPFAAGCQSIGIYPFREALRERPRAVLGLNDISARLYLGRMLQGQLFSFAVPFALFKEMEENLSGSFVEGSTWQELVALRKGGKNG